APRHAKSYGLASAPPPPRGRGGIGTESPNRAWETRPPDEPPRAGSRRLSRRLIADREHHAFGPRRSKGTTHYMKGVQFEIVVVLYLTIVIAFRLHGWFHSVIELVARALHLPVRLISPELPPFAPGFFFSAHGRSNSKPNTRES